ncbi:hypothetical protein MKK75_20425 [Methylobacterium sp. J-030]|nr:hypothetical protein [Methylobacterium sp. J-030]
MNIQYTVDLKAMFDASVNEQKRITDQFSSDQAEGINSISTRGFGRFRSWAERNASVSADR